jgi:hypothetical protein
MKAYRGSRGIDPFILHLCIGWRGVVNFTLRPLYPWERTQVSIEYEVDWASESVWMILEKRKSLALSGIRTSDLSACSGSLLVNEMKRGYVLLTVHLDRIV